MQNPALNVMGLHESQLCQSQMHGYSHCWRCKELPARGEHGLPDPGIIPQCLVGRLGVSS